MVLDNDTNWRCGCRTRARFTSPSCCVLGRRLCLVQAEAISVHRDPHLCATCFTDSSGAHGKALPLRCRPLKSMQLPGSADCADSFSILVPDNENTKQFCLGLWTEFERTLEKSRYFDKMPNKNYQIAKQSGVTFPFHFLWFVLQVSWRHDPSSSHQAHRQ